MLQYQGMWGMDPRCIWCQTLTVTIVEQNHHFTNFAPWLTGFVAFSVGWQLGQVLQCWTECWKQACTGEHKLIKHSAFRPFLCCIAPYALISVLLHSFCPHTIEFHNTASYGLWCYYSTTMCKLAFQTLGLARQNQDRSSVTGSLLSFMVIRTWSVKWRKNKNEKVSG